MLRSLGLSELHLIVINPVASNQMTLPFWHHNMRKNVEEKVQLFATLLIPTNGITHL